MMAYATHMATLLVIGLMPRGQFLTICRRYLIMCYREHTSRALASSSPGDRFPRPTDPKNEAVMRLLAVFLALLLGPRLRWLRSR